VFALGQQDKSRPRAYNFPHVPDDSLEHVLMNLPETGQLIKDRGYRQIWRFEFSGKAYYLKYYPRAGSWWKRLFRGNPAMREFTRLQAMQKAKVPSPRVRSVLVGFRLRGEIGDAVIIDAIEPSVQIDRYLNDLDLQGRAVPGHRTLASAVVDVVRRLGGAKLGHADLHLGNFLLKDDQVYLLDGYAVRPGGLKSSDVALLAYSVRRYATRGDLLRGWDTLSMGAEPPRKNAAAQRRVRKFLEQTTGDNQYYGRLHCDAWSGNFFRHSKFPRRWSRLSELQVTDAEVANVWRSLLDQVNRNELPVLKRSRSGDVLSAEVVIGGVTLPVIVKRPRRKFWYRYLTSIGRASRARRMWNKAWSLFIRNFPVEWPLMVMEKSAFGYVTHSLIVFEKMRGTTLSQLDLDTLAPKDRDTMFRRLGRTLRLIEQENMTHFDAKSSNWIIDVDDPTGPLPILIDVDGVRHYRWTAEGVDRLLRSMREHPQYTVADSLALCQGYAPFARHAREMLRPSSGGVDSP